MIIAIGGYRKDKKIENQIKNELIEQGQNIISLFDIQSEEERESLIQNCDILFILNEDGYTDKITTNEIFSAYKNNKLIIFMSDYILFKKENYQFDKIINQIIKK